MLTKEHIELRKLRLVELALTMTPQNEALADRLEQITLCDMALKYLQVQDQEPVGCVLPDGLVLINAFPHLPANTNLYAAPVPAPSPEIVAYLYQHEDTGTHFLVTAQERKAPMRRYIEVPLCVIPKPPEEK